MRVSFRIGVALLASAALLAACGQGQKPGHPASASQPSLRDTLLAIEQTPYLGGDTTRIVAADSSFTFLMSNAQEGRARVFSFGNRITRLLSEWLRPT